MQDGAVEPRRYPAADARPDGSSPIIRGGLRDVDDERSRLRARADAAWRRAPQLLIGWGERRERREQLAGAALEAESAVLQARLGPVAPGPGDEYFADFPADALLDEPERAAIRDMRGALAEMRPRYAGPEDTSGSYDGTFIKLDIRHSAAPGVGIHLVFGDGYLSLRWPGGEVHDGWDWDPLLGKLVAALLAGRNLQTFHRRLGRVFAIETEVWDEDGRRHDVRRHRIWRRAPLAALPWRAASRRRSLSFDRRQAFTPE